MKQTYMADLGWCMARLTLSELKYEAPRLTIVSPSDSSEGAFDPASSVTVYGEQGLKTLRDLLNAHFGDEP